MAADFPTWLVIQLLQETYGVRWRVSSLRFTHTRKPKLWMSLFKLFHTRWCWKFSGVTATNFSWFWKFIWVHCTDKHQLPSLLTHYVWFPLAFTSSSHYSTTFTICSQAGSRLSPYQAYFGCRGFPALRAMDCLQKISPLRRMPPRGECRPHILSQTKRILSSPFLKRSHSRKEKAIHNSVSPVKIYHTGLPVWTGLHCFSCKEVYYLWCLLSSTCLRLGEWTDSDFKQALSGKRYLLII